MSGSLERDIFSVEMNNLYYLDRVRLRSDQEGPAPEKIHPHQDVLDDLQGRMTRWLESIGDPVLQMEEIYNRAKSQSRERWRKKR